MGLLEFYELCNNHEWFWLFSNDDKICHKGEANEKKLEKLAKQSPRHKRLYDGFIRYHWTGDPWKTKHYSLPRRPKA